MERHLVRSSSVLGKITLVVGLSLAVLSSGCGVTGGAPGPTNPSQLGVSPAAVDFGTVSPGTTSSRSVTISNAGSTNINVNQWGISGSGFSVSGPTAPLTLAQGQNAVLTVTAAPQSPGNMSGNLGISSDASNPAVSVSLSAVAPAPPPP